MNTSFETENPGGSLLLWRDILILPKVIRKYWLCDNNSVLFFAGIQASENSFWRRSPDDTEMATTEGDAQRSQVVIFRDEWISE
jgi:hypothetical protein